MTTEANHLTPEVITLRLKRTSQLRKLCLALGKAKPENQQLGKK